MSTLFDPTREPGDPTPEPGDATPDAQAPSGSPPSLEPMAARRPSVLHLVVGLVYLGLAGLWALSASGTVSSEDTWLLPGLLIVAGATGLVAALAGGRRGAR